VFELGTDGPRRIVAGIDGSETSLRAVAYAAGMARRQGALLTLVYIQPLPTTTNAMAAEGQVTLGQEIADSLRRQITEAVDRADVTHRPRWEFLTQPGDPFRTLIEIADRLRADSVVIGASAKAGHRFVGSVGIRLVKAGRWPVTVVP
jgi:nucleotide-binding universal stress UspA family protein